MSSTYSLTDRTNGAYVIEFSGRQIMKLADYFEDPAHKTPQIQIFTRWAFYTLTDEQTVPEAFESATVAQDLIVMINQLSQHPTDAAIGQTRIIDWLSVLKAGLAYVRKNPAHIYESCYFA